MIENRGRKKKLDEPLSEHIGFVITKSQKIILKEILEENGMDLSTFIRYLIFER